MVGGRTDHVTNAGCDIMPEICRRLAVVHPNIELAAVFRQLVQSPSGMLPSCGQVPVRMQTVDMSTADERPHHFATCVICVPVCKLFRWHVEVDGVAYLQPHAGSHTRRFLCVQESHDFPIDVSIRRLIQVAANRQHRLIWVWVPTQVNGARVPWPCNTCGRGAILSMCAGHLHSHPL